MKKRECQLPKIEKRQGSVEWAPGLFLLLFLAIFLCAELQIFVYQASGSYLEDALAASNLASAVIDIEEYGSSHALRIDEPLEAYRRYQQAVKENLHLNAQWECDNPGLISGRVQIEKYIIYNVKEENVDIIVISEDGHVSTKRCRLGNVRAPNGISVENTGVYSEISFPLKGFFGLKVQAHKGKLVDIVTENAIKGREK